MVEQVAPIETYADYTQHYVESVLWTELGELGAGPAGCIPMGIKFSNDVWFHFLFNQLYTAFGMHRLGKLLDKPGLVDKAEKIKNLILSSPRKGGFFHTIYSFDVVTGYRVARWIPSSGWLPGRISYGTYVDRPEESPRFHLPDCSWTAYWMVRWYAGLEQDERLLNFATEYAEHLLKVQMPSGAFPTFLDAESMEIEPQLMETAGSAASALFLVELYRATQDTRYLEAAERTAAFLKFEVITQRRWQDFEYANDSLAKPAEMYDRFTRQHPQTTMPIFWASELFRTLAAVSKPGPRRDAYMEEALGLVDYLCLYQQVWSPPFLSLACFGGFVVGNGHPAWSDARQGFFPQALMEYYGETGRIEFLERAVAAMRAALPLAFMPENREVSPVWNCGPEGHADENYGHRGQDRRAVPHSIDFGIGYALVSYAFLADRFGDLHVDLKKRTAIGINGLVIEEEMITSEAVTLEVRGVQLGERRLRMKISGCTGGKPLTLEINGKVIRCRPSTEDHEQIIQLDT
jgi:RNase P/RNase MRP subunit p29